MYVCVAGGVCLGVGSGWCLPGPLPPQPSGQVMTPPSPGLSPGGTTGTAIALITQDGSEHSVGFPNIRSVLRDLSQRAQGEPRLGFRLSNTLVSSSLPGTGCRQRQGVAASLGPLFWVPCPISLQPGLPRAQTWGHPIRTVTDPLPSTSVLKHVI